MNLLSKGNQHVCVVIDGEGFSAQ